MPVFFHVCSEAGLRSLCLHFINRAPLLHSLSISTEVKLCLSLRLLSQPILKLSFLPNAVLAISWAVAVQGPGVSLLPPPRLKLLQNLGSANPCLFLGLIECLSWNLSPLLTLQREGLKAGERGPQALACFPKWKTPRFSFLLPADALWLSEPQILSLCF